MRIVLDAMGSDTHPSPEVHAALEAYKLWGEPILLIGPQTELEAVFADIGGDLNAVEIIHAPEVLQMTDKPAQAARGKAETSMAVGMDLLKEGKADAFVTAGNTGGAMATALFRLGRIRGIKRPALAIAFPVQDGYSVMLDIGANTDCRPEYLLQFALMGAVYVSQAFNKKSPRIGLLSNGEEPGKGNMLVKETYPLLEASGVNFIGNVEPKEIFAGEVDVVISDGFDGNVFIKTSEAVSKFLIEIIRDQIRSSALSSIGGLLAKSAFTHVRKLLDPSEYGAGPLLGVNGLVFIGHGRSDAKALVSAIRVARQAVEGDVLEATQTAIRERLAAK
ncbi:MAG: phosphate acyltransferase PlsX [Anaerolineales bacterium]|nr:phosphate acyltransferase PlsX [Anaerolineales bacterium]